MEDKENNIPKCKFGSKSMQWKIFSFFGDKAVTITLKLEKMHANNYRCNLLKELLNIFWQLSHYLKLIKYWHSNSLCIKKKLSKYDSH